jgi:hypothetical protein
MIKKLLQYLTESPHQRILRKLAELYPNHKCRPGIIFSELEEGVYYGGVHVFGISVVYRNIIFTYTGNYKTVLRKIEEFLNERIQTGNY